MNAHQLIEYANRHNVVLWVESDKLEVSGSQEAANDTFIADLKAHKGEVIELLQHKASNTYEPTKTEVGELTRLVCLAYQDFTEKEKAQALHYALSDFKQALICYRAIAAQIWKKKGLQP